MASNRCSTIVLATLRHLLLISLLLASAAHSLPAPAWAPPTAHAVRHVAPAAAPAPLHAAMAPPAGEFPKPVLQELDPVDKCLFTCEFCYKQPKILLSCANECILSAGELPMGRSWLETCPFFAQPIFFDYQPI